jgi:hypothetical protein
MHKNRPTIETLLEAILADDRVTVGQQLKANPALVSAPVSTPRLYQTRICHWIYAGDTALHLAAAGYRVEIVRLLLAAGADPSASRNHRRSGPLHYAADGYSVQPSWDPKRQVKTIEYLVKAGANVNAQDKNGASPLHRSVRTRCAEAVRCFLDMGCDATLPNHSGSTPFHLAVQDTGRGGAGTDAARAAQRQIIQLFLSAGISTSLKDGKGKTVVGCARSDWIRELLSTRTS